jgi:hypothetical protein
MLNVEFIETYLRTNPVNLFPEGIGSEEWVLDDVKEERLWNDSYRYDTYRNTYTYVTHHVHRHDI